MSPSQKDRGISGLSLSANRASQFWRKDEATATLVGLGRRMTSGPRHAERDSARRVRKHVIDWLSRRFGPKTFWNPDREGFFDSSLAEATEPALGSSQGTSPTTSCRSSIVSVFQRADRILVIKDGREVEQGSHDEPLERDREYADLCRHQLGSGLIV